MAKTNELTVKSDNALTEFDTMFFEDHGAGQTDFGQEDLAIPFLQILQALSPQVNKRDGSYIQGAEAGMILDTVKHTVYDGEQGILVIPVVYQRKYIEWIPREKGGGFVADHGNDSSILTQCTKGDKGQDLLPNGNQIVNTANYFVFVVTEEGELITRALITMTSTQLKKSRKWNTMLNTKQLPRPDGKGTFSPAIYYTTFRLRTVPEENDKGSWFGWSIQEEKRTVDLPNGDQLYLAAREFRKSIVSGEIKTDVPVQMDQPGTSSADDGIPF